MDSAQRGLVRCAAAAVLFGATTPFASELARETSAPILAGLLYVGAAFAVAPFVAGQRRSIAVSRRALGPMAVAVLVGGLVGPLVLTMGLARTTGATAALLLNFELPATTLLAAVVFREHIGRRLLAGTVLVVTAGLVLSWSGTPTARIGALLIVAACVCWAIDNCVTANLDSVAPEVITFAKGAIAGVTNLLIGLAVGGALPSMQSIAAALLLGAVGYGVSITLWVAGARDLGAARGQLVFACAPFVGVAVAWLALGESVFPTQVIAVLLAGFGVSAVLGSNHEHRHHHHAARHTHDHDHDAHHQHQHPDAGATGERHSHEHDHVAMVHAHPHVPDVHHRHDH